MFAVGGESALCPSAPSVPRYELLPASVGDSRCAAERPAHFTAAVLAAIAALREASVALSSRAGRVGLLSSGVATHNAGACAIEMELDLRRWVVRSAPESVQLDSVERGSYFTDFSAHARR